MTTRFEPINPNYPHMLHGGDYNPDQWPEEYWKDDMRLMKLAHCNAMSVGIFSWAHLEPEEGKFTFDWLDRIMDMLAENDCRTVLATPSGSKPTWMSIKYPEVCRVSIDGKRDLHGYRHNHCFTSPVYREKCQTINQMLAERYKDHAALLMWHVSNEYSGTCHCELCHAAFRNWLQDKYETLEAMNKAWWTAFWSHDFQDWEQVIPFDTSINGLMLDWQRFTTDQTIDFFNHEAAPLRVVTPDVPVTTNFMGTYQGLDYAMFAKHVDVVSWDNYTDLDDREDTWLEAVKASFVHDLYRSLKNGKPFMLMESTPSVTNWSAVPKQKRPGVHFLASMQAVAHGSDTVQYFQWRAGRGGIEKFHGAVVDHTNSEKTRTFGDVADVGTALEKMDDVVGTSVSPEVAIVYDWENSWAINGAAGPRKSGKNYVPTCENHYQPFWKTGIPVDVISMDRDFSGYKLLVAPMLYMLRPGVAEKIEKFVEAGGTFVATYWSGIVDENDLCFMGGRPGPLRKLLGIWSEEIDALYDDESNTAVPTIDNPLRLSGRYTSSVFCDLVHAEGAEVLAAYGKDFYEGRPCLTVNSFGEGNAYYIASRNEQKFLDDFYGALVSELGLKPALDCKLPTGVTAQVREGDGNRFVFVMNFTAKRRAVVLGAETFTDVVSGEEVSGVLLLNPYDTKIMRA